LEETNYNYRKNLFSYDEIINKQRNFIYNERQIILESKILKSIILSYSEQIIIETLNKFQKSQILLSNIIEIFEIIFGVNLSKNVPINIISKLNNSNLLILQNYFFKEFWLNYEYKIVEYETYNKNSFQNLERLIMLKYIDIGWKDLLYKMNFLRDSVIWRIYGDCNPLLEYQEEAFKLFKNQWFLIRYLIIYNIIRITSSLN